MGDELVQPDDLRAVADACAHALRPRLDRDWSVRAGTLEWSCHFTLLHAGRALFSYASSLSGRWVQPTTFRIASIENRSDDQEASPSTLLDFMQSCAAMLADVCTGTPPDARAYHMAGTADRSGFLAMGCDELLVHTDDILRGFGHSFDPPRERVASVLARLFPWAPRDTDPWETLRWANGRTDLPGLPSPGEDWLWHCAPLSEWDGTTPSMLP